MRRFFSRFSAVFQPFLAVFGRFWPPIVADQSAFQTGDDEEIMLEVLP
jgi:hypothetical protein